MRIPGTITPLVFSPPGGDDVTDTATWLTSHDLTVGAAYAQARHERTTGGVGRSSSEPPPPPTAPLSSALRVDARGAPVAPLEGHPTGATLFGHPALGGRIPVVSIHRRRRRLSRAGEYFPVESSHHEGYCVRDVIDNLMVFFLPTHPYWHLLNSFRATAAAMPLLPLSTITCFGIGVMTLGGEMFWRGALPDIFMVMADNDGLVWHAVGWTYVRDAGNFLNCCESDLPNAVAGARPSPKGAKPAAGLSKRSAPGFLNPRTNSVVKSAMARAKKFDPDVADPVEAGITVLREAGLKTRIDAHGLRGVEERLAKTWNALMRPDGVQYKPLSVTAAMSKTGFTSNLETGMVFDDPQFAPLGKGTGSWSFDPSTRPEGTARSDTAWDFNIVGSYALARALSLPARQVYVASSDFVPPFAASAGVHWSAAPPAALVMPCVVVFPDCAGDMYALWDRAIHQAKVKEPTLEATLLMVQMKTLQGTGTIRDLAFVTTEGATGRTYAVSGDHGWLGKGSIGSSLACLDRGVFQVAAAGVFRCSQGKASVTTRPVVGEPMLLASGPDEFPPDVQQALTRTWGHIDGSGDPPPFLKPAQPQLSLPPLAVRAPVSSASSTPTSSGRSRREAPNDWTDLLVDSDFAPSPGGSGAAGEAKAAPGDLRLDKLDGESDAVYAARLKHLLMNRPLPTIVHPDGCQCLRCCGARTAALATGHGSPVGHPPVGAPLGRPTTEAFPRHAKGPSDGRGFKQPPAPDTHEPPSSPQPHGLPPSGPSGPPPPGSPGGPDRAMGKKVRRRPSRYAAVTVGREARADWWWAGPEGVYSGQDARARAGEDAVGLPPLASVMVQTLAEKSDNPQAAQARYNIATNAFFSQNSENKRNGKAMLSEEDRRQMVENVSPFLNYCVAWRHHRELVAEPRFKAFVDVLNLRAHMSSKGVVGRQFMRFKLWLKSLWHRLFGYLYNPFAPKPVPPFKGGIIATSSCPRRLLTTTLQGLTHMPSKEAAMRFLEEQDNTKVHLVVLKEPPSGAFDSCDEKPRFTFAVGPTLMTGSQALAGCACQAYHTISERCTRGALSQARVDAMVADAVFDHAVTDMARYSVENEAALASALEATPTTLEEYAQQAKFKRKYGLLSIENWVEPVMGPPVSTMLVKREKIFNDPRGRLVIDASATNSAQAMGPHQSLMTALKLSLLSGPPGHGDTSVCTCGMSQPALRDKFQEAADDGRYHAYLSDASALEATQAEIFQEGGDKVLRAAADLVERYHPDEDVKLHNALALQQRAASRTHVMKYPDYAGAGARATEIVARGYFITGSPWTTVGNTANVAAVILEAHRGVVARGHNPGQLSVAGDDQVSLFHSAAAADAMMELSDGLATGCALVFKSFVGDIRDSPSTVMYNQKHIVCHDAVVWLFQNPARGLVGLGRVVQPNCADPKYLPGHAKAYLLSYASEYSGVPLFHAYVTAGLAYYCGERPTFDRDTAYWYGMNEVGRPLTPAEARDHAQQTPPSCPSPTAAARRAYEHAFLVSIERQLELEDLLGGMWKAQDWRMDNAQFADILDLGQLYEGKAGLWLGERSPAGPVQARL